MAGSKLILGIIALFITINGWSQITTGRIVFERKTNLLKRFDDPQFKDFLKDNKVKIDNFELLFNDTSCVFRPIPTETVDELAWATTKNTVYQNLNTDERISVLDLWGNTVYVRDSMKQREWKITENTRNIAGYDCRKAIWQKDDSTRIYAWFAIDLVPSIGPEMFSGLPGTILGLATEDGGIIYFAKEVKVKTILQKDLTYEIGKNKVYSPAALQEEMMKQFGNQPWGARAINELFRWY